MMLVFHYFMGQRYNFFVRYANFCLEYRVLCLENVGKSVVLKKICSFVCVCAYFLVTLRAFYIAPYYDRIY